jgi:hypothetical protein
VTDILDGSDRATCRFRNADVLIPYTRAGRRTPPRWAGGIRAWNRIGSVVRFLHSAVIDFSDSAPPKAIPGAGLSNPIEDANGTARPMPSWRHQGRGLRIFSRSRGAAPSPPPSSDPRTNDGVAPPSPNDGSLGPRIALPVARGQYRYHASQTSVDRASPGDSRGLGRAGPRCRRLFDPRTTERNVWKSPNYAVGR